MKPKLENKKEKAFDRREYIKPAEFERFIEVIHKKDIMFKLMFKIGYYLGLRPIEYRHIHIEDLNFNDNSLVVRLGKTNKIKVRKVPKKLMNEIREYLEKNKFRLVDSYLFVGYNGEPYEVNTIEKKFRYYAKKVGWLEPMKVETSVRVSNIGRKYYHKRLYSLRVSFITNMYLIYGDIIKVSKIIGHELSRTTEGYVRNIVFDEEITMNDLYESGIRIIEEKIEKCSIYNNKGENINQLRPNFTDLKIY